MAKSYELDRVNVIAGAFVLAIALFLMCTLVVTARVQRWFEPVKTLRIVMPPEGFCGLKQGADVQIVGAVAGSVEGTAIHGAGRIEANITVREDFFLFVRDDSVVLIKPKLGLAGGDAYVEISRGQGRELPDGAILKATVTRSIQAVLKETLGQAKGGVLATADEYRQLAADLRSPEGQFQRALTQFNAIAKALMEGEGVAGKFLKDEQLAKEFEQSVIHLRSSMDDVQTTLKDVKRTVAMLPDLVETVNLQIASLSSVRERVEKALDAADRVLQDVHQTTASLPPIAEAASKEARDLPGLVMETKDLLQQLKKLVVGLQKHWLVRDYVQQRQPLPRIPTSAVGAQGERP